MQLDAIAPEPILDADLIDRVLEQLRLPNRPTTDLDGLTELYSAWCRNVPFDNLRKLIHVQSKNPSTLPGDNAVDFFESWLKHRTGGTCWAGNGALHALLSALGFKTSRGVATMLVTPDVPPNHGTVLVDLDGLNYLVDASILHEFPLPLDLATKNVDQKRFKLHLQLREDKWHIWWQPLHIPDGLECRLDSFPASHADFQSRHELTRKWSPFNFQLNVRKISGQKAIGIGFGNWVELDKNGVATRKEIGSEQERLGLLIDSLGYSEEIAKQLPRDQPTPPPPQSNAARRNESKYSPMDVRNGT